MAHNEVDQFARRSALYRFDPRVKLASMVTFVVIVAFLREPLPLLVCLAFVLALIALSRVPAAHIGRSFLLAVPFIAFASLALLLYSGPYPAAAMALRISVSVLALLLLITTTPFFDLLQALQWFRLPRLMTTLVMFTYRFIFVLLDEMDRMTMARKARGFSVRGSLLSREVFRTLSYTAGMAFVRANERARNIYDALLTRGFTGEVVTLERMRAGARDAGFAAPVVGVAILSLLLQMDVVRWTP